MQIFDRYWRLKQEEKVEPAEGSTLQNTQHPIRLEAELRGELESTRTASAENTGGA
jgi:hypothetical protein